MDVAPDKTYSYQKVALVEKNNSSFKLDSHNLKVASSYEETVTIVKMERNEGTSSAKNCEGIDVGIIASSSACNENPAEDRNSTEYSSSFDGSVSDFEVFPGSNEAEVESTFYDHSTMVNGFDGFGNVFPSRKRKLTDNWRNFIHPLMWRCKWAELKIRQLESQSFNYSKELSAHDQAEHPELDQYAFDDFSMRSQPFYGNSRYMRSALKRRNRKRAEDTIDVSSYMRSHNLFSYYETKRSCPDGLSMPDEFNNSVITYQNDNESDDFSISNDQLFLEVRGGDNSLEPVLLKIERAQSRVQKLKSQLDGLMLKNAVKIGSSDNLSLLEQTSSLLSSICAPDQCISNFNCGDLVLPGSAVSSFMESNSIPDIVESTVGMLSATEVHAHQPHMADSHEIIVDNVFLHREVTEREKQTCRTHSHVPMKVEQGESTGPCTIAASGREHVERSIISGEVSKAKASLGSDFHFLNKRKRGERKACSGNWIKRESCEPDSQ